MTEQYPPDMSETRIDASSINLEVLAGHVYLMIGADYVQQVRPALSYYQRHLPETDWEAMDICPDTHQSRLNLRAASRAALGMCEVRRSVEAKGISGPAYEKQQRHTIEFGAATLDALQAQHKIGDFNDELLELAVDLEAEMAKIS